MLRGYTAFVRFPALCSWARRCPTVGSMFLFEQTAAFIPDLFRALPVLEYIADQPGPRGRAFGKREKLLKKSTSDCRWAQAGLN
jgi:hypothetical protein